MPVEQVKKEGTAERQKSTATYHSPKHTAPHYKSSSAKHPEVRTYSPVVQREKRKKKFWNFVDRVLSLLSFHRQRDIQNFERTAFSAFSIVMISVSFFTIKQINPFKGKKSKKAAAIISPILSPLSTPKNQKYAQLDK